ncbi:hypothetical protein LLG95_07260 [bacterium]|nr:hypothetical protein [bacterium]
MARLARVVEGVPYHIAHRGNRRGDIFFSDAECWPWSSARAQALGEADPMLDPERPFAAGVRDPLTGRFMAWTDWLARGLREEEVEELRDATRTGRPCGDEMFVKRLEAELDRLLAPQKRGPKLRADANTPEIPGLF